MGKYPKEYNLIRKMMISSWGWGYPILAYAHKFGLCRVGCWWALYKCYELVAVGHFPASWLSNKGIYGQARKKWTYFSRKTLLSFFRRWEYTHLVDKQQITLVHHPATKFYQSSITISKAPRPFWHLCSLPLSGHGLASISSAVLTWCVSCSHVWKPFFTSCT